MYRRNQKKNLPIYVSNITLIEAHKKLLFDLGYRPALNFLDEVYLAIEGKKLSLVRVIESDELEAKKIITKYYDQNFTFYDAINFSIMKRTGIGKAFAFDVHYSVIGFQKIPPFFF